MNCTGKSVYNFPSKTRMWTRQFFSIHVYIYFKRALLPYKMLIDTGFWTFIWIYSKSFRNVCVRALTRQFSNNVYFKGHNSPNKCWLQLFGFFFNSINIIEKHLSYKCLISNSFDKCNKGVLTRLVDGNVEALTENMDLSLLSTGKSNKSFM